MSHDTTIWWTDILLSLKTDTPHKDNVVAPCLCKQVDGSDIQLLDGNLTCARCGTVVDRYIDQAAEWRTFGDETRDDPSRCGCPTDEFLPKTSMGTFISMRYGEKSCMRLIRRMHAWNSIDAQENKLHKVFEYITIHAHRFGIPNSIINEAKMFYKNMAEKYQTRGALRKGIIASSLYMSCKQNNAIRSAKEIAKIFDVDTSCITKGCKRMLMMSVKDASHRTNNASTAHDFVGRFGSYLGIDPVTIAYCHRVIDRIDENDVPVDNTPPCVAGAVLFLCTRSDPYEKVVISSSQSVLSSAGSPPEALSLMDIADVSCLSFVTVSKCYKLLFRFANLLLD